MTKTLTEQWREGTLEDGFYYIKKNMCGIKDIKTEELFSGEFCTVPNEYIEEVLAPVPSYDKHNKLKKLPLKCFQLEEDNSALMVINKDMCKEKERIEKKLEIATKALKEIDVRSQRDWNEYDCMGCAKKALYDIEMEGVK